jgi:hypothetical protein
MMGTTPPPGTSCRPCQLDPERWFDRHDHADALSGCLACPARRWCAREALKCRASWGLWAGVWIDGRHEDAVPHLHAVAAGALAQSSEVAAVVIDGREGGGPTGDSHWAPTSLRRPDGSSLASSVRTAVLARSYGHCEVFGDGCGYTYDRLVGRHSAIFANETPTPPDLFTACSSCADMVAALDPKLAVQFGYVADTQRSLAHVPFYWRQSRWVLLDRDGWLTEIADDAQTA